jgi:hypothetical protein
MTEPGKCDFSKPFAARPSGSEKFHVFKPDCRSMCGKWAILMPCPYDSVNLTGKETFGGEDCLPCARKAGFKGLPGPKVHASHIWGRHVLATKSNKRLPCVLCGIGDDAPAAKSRCRGATK